MMDSEVVERLSFILSGLMSIPAIWMVLVGRAPVFLTAWDATQTFYILIFAKLIAYYYGVLIYTMVVLGILGSFSYAVDPGIIVSFANSLLLSFVIHALTGAEGPSIMTLLGASLLTIAAYYQGRITYLLRLAATCIVSAVSGYSVGNFLLFGTLKYSMFTIWQWPFVGAKISGRPEYFILTILLFMAAGMLTDYRRNTLPTAIVKDDEESKEWLV